MKITENVHALKHHFQIPVSPELKVDRFVYSYIVFGKQGLYLVDAGVAASGSVIFDYIIQNDRSVDEVKLLLLTHSHPDHIGSAQQIKATSGCDIIAHPEEKEWIEDIQKQHAERPVPGFDTLVAGGVKVDGPAEDGKVLDLEEEIRARIMHTPGHSKGSISFFFENEGVLITGDCVLLPGQFPIYDDVAAGAASVKKLRQLPDLNVLLSAWDEPRAGDEALQKIDQSLDYLAKIRKTIEEIEHVRELDQTELCRRVIAGMGLPASAANPLVGRALFLNAQRIGMK